MGLVSFLRRGGCKFGKFFFFFSFVCWFSSQIRNGEMIQTKKKDPKLENEREREICQRVIGIDQITQRRKVISYVCFCFVRAGCGLLYDQ